MVAPGSSEFIIQEVVGCGPFQVIMGILVYTLGKSCAVFTMVFMAFGNYNPGWKCLQEIETSTNASSSGFSNASATTTPVAINETGWDRNSSHVTTPSFLSSGYELDNCPIFETCQDVVFNPDSSTIVSEWGLVCNHKWISSIIISIQMAGLAIGCPIAGHLGDAVGRKMSFYLPLLAMTILNFVTVLSPSWQVFAVIRFFLGVTVGFSYTLLFMYTAEFVPEKWRSILASTPSWHVSGILFALTCMYLKDWRHVHIVTGFVGLLGFVPVFWVPESLRFLEVKNKRNEFKRVSEKIARINRKTLPSTESLEKMTFNQSDTTTHQIKQTYNFVSLFRKEYRMLTFLITVPWFYVSFVYYAIGFGVKALHGNFYLNLIIFAASEMPFSVIPMVLAHRLGRRFGSIILVTGTAICLLSASGFEELSSSSSTKAIGVLVLISTAKVTTGAFWCILALHTMELYPTVVRGIATSWSNLAARISGILAPFIIPNDPGTVFISYAVMGIFSLVCCAIMIKLPETKGKPLKDGFKTETTPSADNTAI